MASKSLLRSSAFFMYQFSKPLLQQTPRHYHPLIAPSQLFPSFLNRFPVSPYFPQNDVESPKKISSQLVDYPCGLPSLEFFLPEGDSSSSEDPMILFPKRTFQPSLIRRKRNHGFFARKATKGGRKVIARRIAKGRSRITA